MFELIRAGGILMLPIVLCSIIAFGIVIERLWTLKRSRVAPPHLVSEIWQWAKDNQITLEHLAEIRSSSPLGRILAAGLVNLSHSREIMKESIEDTGRHVIRELERYLNTLGTIASITPLLGLLGTVIGMIKVFSAITTEGVGNPTVLAGGISEALITTAAGLSVAIPSLMMHRYLQGNVDNLVATMEQEAMKMVEILQGEREQDDKPV